MTTQTQIRTSHRLNALAVALASALALSACGGGGGGMTRNDPPPSNPPGDPGTPPTQQTCQDHNATNYGGPLPCTYPPARYSGVGDNILVPANADKAHDAGFTGQGVKVGILDDGYHSPYAALDSKIAWSRDYSGHEGEDDPSPKDGHGNVVAATLAGTASGTFKGGVAPGVSLYWGRVCWSDSCDGGWMASAMTDMAAKGVQLFNASFGIYKPNPTAEATWYADNIGPILTANDALLVVSAGNDGASNVSTLALAPTIDPALAEHMIVVTGVNIDSSGNPSGKNAQANACGDAAQWCIAAPWQVQVPGVPGTPFASGNVAGTSVAAPIVTGTAALVWQAFPWMTASNVQETVLTTATDLGAAGVDAVYGWGMVNAEKAVQGPGLFIGTFEANVIGNSTFANAIGGSGSLLKLGNGTLTLSADNTYAGGTDVQDGTLMLTGKLASDVLVGSGATFGSMGGTISGDYTAASGGTTAIQVGAGLSITGTASLSGALVLLPEASSYSIKPTETLLTAGAITGTFGNVTYGSGFFWTAALAYDPTSITATMTRNSVAASAQSFGASQAAVDGGRMADIFLASVDQRAASGQATQQEKAMAVALASAPTAELASSSLASLTGEANGTARTLDVQAALDAGNVLADRTRSLGRFGDSGVWLQATGQDGALHRGGYATADYDQSGAMVGVDVQIRDGLIVGAAIGGNRTHASLDGLAGSVRGTGTTLAAYGRVAVGQAGYIAGDVLHTSGNATIHRDLLVGTTLYPVEGRHGNDTTLARIEGGILLPNGITPYMALGVLHQRQGAFTESGASGFELTANADSYSATFADLGLRYDHASGPWVVGFDLSARHLFGGSDTGFDAAFAGVPAKGFIVSGQPLASNVLRVGGHAFYKTASGWVWYVNAGASQSSGQGRNAWISGGFKVGF